LEIETNKRGEKPFEVYENEGDPKQKDFGQTPPHSRYFNKDYVQIPEIKYKKEFKPKMGIA